MDKWECQVFKTLTKNTQEQNLSTTMLQEKCHQAQKKKLEKTSQPFKPRQSKEKGRIRTDITDGKWKIAVTDLKLQ